MKLFTGLYILYFDNISIGYIFSHIFLLVFRRLIVTTPVLWSGLAVALSFAVCDVVSVHIWKTLPHLFPMFDLEIIFMKF